jgi:hypothetical protein
LTISDVTENGKILLVSLAKLGDISRNIFGSLIISKIKQAIFRRENISEKSKRRPFYLYVDEFQEFVTTGFHKALQHGGKYALGLTLANHYPGQLGSDLMNDIRGIVSTYILFKMNADLAQPLASEIEPYDTGDLTTLSVGEALYKPFEGSPEFVVTPPPPSTPTQQELMNAETVRKYTFTKYGPTNAPSVEMGSNRVIHTKPSDTQTRVVSLEKDDDITPTSQPKNIPPHED